MSAKEKQVKINEKTFTIKKFTPQLGCYWAFQLLGSLASGISSGGIAGAVQGFMQMEPDRFAHFQKDCLQNCFFENSNGRFSLINQNGSIAYPDELTAPDLFQLTTHSFMFTLADFLEPALVEGLKNELTTMFPTLGSETSSTSQSPKGTGSKKNSGTEPTP